MLLRRLLLPLAALAGVCRARLEIVNTTAGATIRLGALLPADTDPNHWLGAAQLAVQDLNAADGLFADNTLELVVKDEGTHGAASVIAVQELVSDDAAAAIVGPINSDNSELTGYAASQLGVNIIDPFARQSSLSDKAVYPFFSRLSQPQKTEAGDMVKVCQALGWERVGVFMGISSGTVDFLSSFVPLARDAGMDVLPPVQFPLDTTQEQLYVDQLKATGARVYIFLVPITNSLHWMTVLARAGLLEPEYTMVTPSVSWFDNSNMTAELGAEFEGIVQTGPSSVNADAAVMTAWGERLSEHLRGIPNDVESGINVWFTQMVYDSFVTAGRALDALVQLRRVCDALPVDGGGNADCVQYRADADEDVTLRRLVRGTRVTEGYLGAEVELDPETGDRVGPSICIQLNPYHVAPFVSVHLRALIFPGTGYTATDEYEWKDKTLAAGEVPRDRPLVVSELDTMPTGLFAATALLAGIGIAVCVLCAAATVAYRREKVIVMSSWRVNLVSTVGGTALLVPAFFGGAAPTAATCSARTSLLTLGFTLLFAPLFSKVYRVHRIFGQKMCRTVKVTDAKLFEMIAALLLVDAVLLGAWAAVGFVDVQETPLDPVPTSTPNLELQVVERACVSRHTPVFVGLLLSYKAALLVSGSYLSYKCRDVQIKALNDSKWIGLSIYTTTLIALLAVPTLFVAGENQDAQAVLVTAASFLVVVSAMALVFLPKFLAIWRGTTEEWVVKSAPGAGSSPGSGARRTEMHAAPSKSALAAPAAPAGASPVVSLKSASGSRARLSVVSAAGVSVDEAAKRRAAGPGALEMQRFGAASPLNENAAGPSSQPASPQPVQLAPASP